MTLLLTGVVWLFADAQKERPTGEIWQGIAVWMLTIHGGVAMIALILLGAMIPLHIQRGWRSGRNLITGSAMVTLNVILIVTAFGLYYSGSDLGRPWMTAIHTVFGLAAPLVVAVHIFIGRRSI